MSQERDIELSKSDAATANMDGLSREDCDNVSSSVKISASKMASEDEAVPSAPRKAKTKVEESVTVSDDYRVSGSDRNRISHHL